MNRTRGKQRAGGKLVSWGEGSDSLSDHQGGEARGLSGTRAMELGATKGRFRTG